MFHKSFRNVMMAAALALPVVSLNVNSAVAGDARNFTVINGSHSIIDQLYVESSQSSDWGEDILGKDILKPGESTYIYFTDNSKTCTYDIKAVYTDNSTSTGQYNLCETHSITFTE